MTKIRAKIHDFSNCRDDEYIIVTEEQYKAIEWFIDKYEGDLEITKVDNVKYSDLT